MRHYTKRNEAYLTHRFKMANNFIGEMDKILKVWKKQVKEVGGYWVS